MLDIEAAIIGYLSKHLDCPVYADVPNPRPERFVTVERTGGGSMMNGAVDQPTVAIQSWETTRAKAANLAYDVDDFMAFITNEVTNVMGCSLNSLYNFPDPDSRSARYQGIYDLTTN